MMMMKNWTQALKMVISLTLLTFDRIISFCYIFQSYVHSDTSRLNQILYRLNLIAECGHKLLHFLIPKKNPLQKDKVIPIKNDDIKSYYQRIATGVGDAEV
jgi:hypothetical protein